MFYPDSFEVSGKKYRNQSIARLNNINDQKKKKATQKGRLPVISEPECKRFLEAI